MGSARANSTPKVCRSKPSGVVGDVSRADNLDLPGFAQLQ
jgi:hypothetical protein